MQQQCAVPVEPAASLLREEARQRGKAKRASSSVVENEAVEVEDGHIDVQLEGDADMFDETVPPYSPAPSSTIIMPTHPGRK